MKRALISLRNNFVVGFIAILPLALSLWIFFELVGFVVGFTDTLLVFLPHELRETVWKPFWRVLAFIISVAVVTLLGFIAKNVLGRSILTALENLALRIPLLNKIYGGIKQMFEAFGSTRSAAFQRVVLVRFPHRDSYCIGFVTSDASSELDAKTGTDVVSVFLPTTPNPTSGYLLIVPRHETIPLDMTVGDAVKMVISGGAVVPQSGQDHPKAPTSKPDGNP